MIKEALEYLAGLQTPQHPPFRTIGGDNYAITAKGEVGDYIAPHAPPFTKPIFAVSTLSGLVALYTAGVDRFDADRSAVHIVDPFTARIVSLDADEFGQRHVYAQAQHQQENGFKFNTYYEPEPFLLAFRASFLITDNAVSVIKLCSAVTAGNSVSTADDGISQEVRVVVGTVTKSSIPLPVDGVPLVVARTFREASAVESKFLLRMQGVKDGLPKMALFEIDTKWKLDTVASIRHYLEKHLPKDTLLIA